MRMKSQEVQIADYERGGIAGMLQSSAQIFQFGASWDARSGHLGRAKRQGTLGTAARCGCLPARAAASAGARACTSAPPDITVAAIRSSANFALMTSSPGTRGPRTQPRPSGPRRCSAKSRSLVAHGSVPVPGAGPALGRPGVHTARGRARDSLGRARGGRRCAGRWRCPRGLRRWRGLRRVGGRAVARPGVTAAVWPRPPAPRGVRPGSPPQSAIPSSTANRTCRCWTG